MHTTKHSTCYSLQQKIKKIWSQQCENRLFISYLWSAWNSEPIGASDAQVNFRVNLAQHIGICWPKNSKWLDFWFNKYQICNEDIQCNQLIYYKMGFCSIQINLYFGPIFLTFLPKKLKLFKFKEIHCQIRVSHAKLHIKYHCCPVVWIICWWMQQNSKIRNVLKTSFWPFWPFALKQDIDHYTWFCRSWEGLHNALLIFGCCFENFLKIGEKLIFRKIAIFRSVDYFGHSTLTDRKTLSATA